MPTFNKVINQKIFKTVANGSKQIKIGWATQTDTWERLHLAETIQENFAKAVEKAADNGELPTKGAKVIMTEKEHISDADKRDHFTGVVQDENGQYLKTQHFVRED